MDKEKETVWTSDMGFMPPIPKTEGRTICREECQLTEYKQEIERLREAAKDRPKDRPNEAANEIERLREENKQYLECLIMMARVALDALKPKENE